MYTKYPVCEARECSRNYHVVRLNKRLNKFAREIASQRKIATVLGTVGDNRERHHIRENPSLNQEFSREEVCFTQQPCLSEVEGFTSTD